MKITRCATAVVEANYDYTYVRIHADNGVYGTGECFFAAGLTAALRQMFHLLIGRDPREVDRLAKLLWRQGSGAGAVAGEVGTLSLSVRVSGSLSAKCKRCHAPLFRTSGSCAYPRPEQDGIMRLRPHSLRRSSPIPAESLTFRPLSSAVALSRTPQSRSIDRHEVASLYRQ
jgi:hypothetical protein